MWNKTIKNLAQDTTGCMRTFVLHPLGAIESFAPSTIPTGWKKVGLQVPLL